MAAQAKGWAAGKGQREMREKKGEWDEKKGDKFFGTAGKQNWNRGDMYLI